MIQLLWNNFAVAIKSPEFGDSISKPMNTLVKRSMNKTPYSFIEPDPLTTLSFNFQQASRVQVRNFWQLMRLSKGRNITLIDHNNTRWYGTVITNPLTTSHNAINNSNFSFNFEGVRVETD